LLRIKLYSYYKNGIFTNKIIKEHSMSFGKKLLELRKQKGLSQEDLAFELGISQSSVSNYESDLTRPDILILEKVSNYFQTPVSELVPADNSTFYNYQNSGGNNGYVINQLPEKLIEQYEQTIRSLKEQIEVLKLLLEMKK